MIDRILLVCICNQYLKFGIHLKKKTSLESGEGTSITIVPWSN